MISNKRGDPQRKMGNFDCSWTYIGQHCLRIFGTSIWMTTNRLNHWFTYQLVARVIYWAKWVFL